MSCDQPPVSAISRDSASAWTLSAPDDSKQRDIARDAYRDAIEYLEQEVAHSSRWPLLSSIEDIFALIRETKASYELRKEKRGTLKWLSRLSGTVMHYSQVMDMLSQQHPEYVALIWGSMKFVLMGVINHAELLEKLSKALVKIGSVLPRTKLNSELYQTTLMKEAVSRLYAYIILFFQRAVKWYNMSSASRAIASIFKPFELDYKDTVEQIKLCSETVDKIASASGRAEVRDMHIMLQLQQEMLSRRDEKLEDMQKQMKDMQHQMNTTTDKVSQILQVATAHRAMTEIVQLDVGDMKPRIYQIQFAHILSALKPRISADDQLFKCQSLARRAAHARVSAFDARTLTIQLEQWLSKEQSFLFLIKAGPRAELRSKEFAINVVKFLQDSSCSVVWSLSNTINIDRPPSLSELIQGLIYQCLSKYPDLLDHSLDELNITRFQQDHTEIEWVSLLYRLFARLERCFIVVETEELFQANRANPQWALQFLDLFQTLVVNSVVSGNMLKILVVSYHTSTSALDNMPGNDNRIVASLAPPIPVPPRLRRPINPRKRKGEEWHHLRPKIWRGDGWSKT